MKPVTIVDDHLLITHEVYSTYKGRHMQTEALPIANIECIKATVGPQGGMHTWSVRGYDPKYSDSGYFDDRKRDIEIFSGDRKSYYLIDEIMKALPEIKYHEKVEDGGAPW